MTPDPMTFLRERLAAGRESLVAAGIAPTEAAVDVDLFARTILGWDRARVLAAGAEPVPSALEPRFSEWILRRSRREPSAYIVGTREFWGLDFRVTRDVLIPRPESEFIVEESMAILNAARLPSPRIADIGTGSGCLAISLAHEIPAATFIATDVSPTALIVAQENARRHGVDGRLTFVETSCLDGIGESFDLIVANPPYVKDGDKAALPHAVRHEPDLALFGGADGLHAVEAVLDASVDSLRHRGWLVMEFGFGQEAEVRDLLMARPSLTLRRVREDLLGIPRTVIVQRTAA